MSLDFLQVSQQVKQMGEKASLDQPGLQARVSESLAQLQRCPNELEQLREKVRQVVQDHDSTLRCAVPVGEALDSHYPLPTLTEEVTLIAADGSQIFADRHAEVDYCLVNTGAIWMRSGSSETPSTSIRSRLIYADELDGMSDERLSLQRDLAERTRLLEIASQVASPSITMTDGPLELWTTTLEEGRVAGEFKKALEVYLGVLRGLHELDATTAGYVDKPGADLVVRLLEADKAGTGDLARIRTYHPFKGVTDRQLYLDLLPSSERSAVFAIQSRSASSYQDDLKLHFFYLNVGIESHPYIARVEIPAWVAVDRSRLDALHTVLVSQCRITGAHAYPYLLHRAHETAVVSLEDKGQVTQMIVNELRKRGVELAGASAKQLNKDIAGKRTRYGA
jgi:hypothetical protein